MNRKFLPIGILRAKRKLCFVGMVFLMVMVACWYGYSPFLGWGITKGVTWFAARQGIHLEIDHLKIRFAEPIEMEKGRLQRVVPTNSATKIEWGRTKIFVNSLWEIVFKKHRIIQNIEIEGLTGTFDFRNQALVPQRMPLRDQQQQKRAATRVSFLPLQISLKAPKLLFLADGQSYEIREMALQMSEKERGFLQWASIRIEIGPIRQELDKSKAITAWKEGVLYLANLTLLPHITLERVAADLANPKGVTFSSDASVYGGSIRSDLLWSVKKGAPFLEATLAIFTLPLEPMQKLLPWKPGSLSGYLRDARFTFRGNPYQMIDAEIALRISADNFQWKDYRWLRLMVGTNFIGRKLYVSEFRLKQKENEIFANGEMTIREKLEAITKQPFLLNVSAKIEDLKEFSALFGEPFKEVTGCLSLAGTISGTQEKANGYLHAKAHSVYFRGLSNASATFSSVLTDNELKIERLEAWNGTDSITSKGALAIKQLNPYSGEVSLRIADISRYTSLFGASISTKLQSGAIELHWQGDGMRTSHSGAFHTRLKHLITCYTPNGMTASFEGTYSPENIYLSHTHLEHGKYSLDSKITLSALGINVTRMQVISEKKPLLTGEAFVPLNSFEFAQGKSFVDSLKRNQPVYMELASETIALRELGHLIGQKTHGSEKISLRLKATGTVDALALEGELKGRNLPIKIQRIHLPASNLDLKFTTVKRQLFVKGGLKAKNLGVLPLEGSGKISIVNRPFPLELSLFSRSSRFPALSAPSFSSSLFGSNKKLSVEDCYLSVEMQPFVH